MVVAKAPHFPDNRINRTAYDEVQPTHEQSTSSQGRLDNGQNLSLPATLIRAIEIVSKSRDIGLLRRSRPFLPRNSMLPRTKEKKSKKEKIDGREMEKGREGIERGTMVGRMIPRNRQVR